jgi:hypothetical protein
MIGAFDDGKPSGPDDPEEEDVVPCGHRPCDSLRPARCRGKDRAWQIAMRQEYRILHPHHLPLQAVPSQGIGRHVDVDGTASSYGCLGLLDAPMYRGQTDGVDHHGSICLAQDRPLCPPSPAGIHHTHMIISRGAIILIGPENCTGHKRFRT